MHLAQSWNLLSKRVNNDHDRNNADITNDDSDDDHTCSKALLIHSVLLVSSLSKGAPFSMTYIGTSSCEAQAMALYRLWGSMGYPMSASSTLLNLLLGAMF